jgi:hypothetical protein
MNLHSILSLDIINGFKYFIKYNILGFYKNTENVKGLNRQRVNKGWGCRIKLGGKEGVVG